VTTMKGRVLDKDRVNALDYCHMITAQTSRFHFCRRADCRFFALEEHWANTVQDRRTGCMCCAALAIPMPLC
jgi:hypothetical protein